MKGFGSLTALVAVGLEIVVRLGNGRWQVVRKKEVLPGSDSSAGGLSCDRPRC